MVICCQTSVYLMTISLCIHATLFGLIIDMVDIPFLQRKYVLDHCSKVILLARTTLSLG